jgi:hypothetical protein
MRVKTGVFQSAKNAVRPIFLLKLPRRHVDADGNGRTACILPFLILAACLMQNPVSTMSPVSSASGMNWIGDITPSVGCFERIRASTAKTRPDFKST